MSDKKISDTVIADAAELLYKGAKMLTYHCPDCKLPLFERDGKIFCPSCGREAVFEGKEAESLESKSESKNVSENRRKRYENANTTTTTDADIARKVEAAVMKVCDMIVSAKTSEEVTELSNSLEKLVNVLEKLKRG